MKIVRLIACTTLLASMPLSATEQPGPAVEPRPGYVDFAELAADYGEPRVMIDLGSSLLTLVSAMQRDDPAAQEALRSLDSVRVQVFDTGGLATPAAERMQAIEERLAAQQWQPVVRVREPGKRVDIHVMQAGERIQGITVMALDEEEIVFINILGDIDPAQLHDVVASIEVGPDLDLVAHTP